METVAEELEAENVEVETERSSTSEPSPRVRGLVRGGDREREEGGEREDD